MLKTFPTLYAKNKNGAWKEWRVCVRLVGGIPHIETQHGLLQGKKIMETLIISEAKRGYASLWDQAVFTAQSKWNHKHNRQNYQPTMEHQEDHNHKTFSPMLAKTFDHGKHLHYPLYIQPKIDGLRCLAHPHGLFSRTGCPFLGLDAIQHDIKRYFLGQQGVVVVDGELYSEEMPFEELSGYCRRQKEVPSGKKVVFHVFDVIHQRDDMPFEDRIRLFPKETEHIRCVPTRQIETPEQIETNLKEFVGEGYEGIILRNKDGVYRKGHRSWDLQKYKLFQEEEFEITGHTEGTGREKGMVIWQCQTAQGKTFHVRPEGGHDTRRHLWNNADDYRGKKLTVVFQEYTKDRIPRFPVAKALREEY
jgi:DNA ligase-1